MKEGWQSGWDEPRGAHDQVRRCCRAPLTIAASHVPVQCERVQHGHADTVAVADVADDHRQPVDEGGGDEHEIDIVVSQRCRQTSPALHYRNTQAQNPVSIQGYTRDNQTFNAWAKGVERCGVSAV